VDLPALAQATAAHARQQGLAEASSSFVFDPQEDGVMAVATVTITISDPGPSLAADFATTPANTPVSIDVLANDNDPLGRELVITSVAQPQAGQGSVAIAPDRRSVTFTPALNFVGVAQFTYEAAPV
jgi:large repetitive protein